MQTTVYRYTYDGNGIRTGKSVTSRNKTDSTQYLWDVNMGLPQVLTESDGKDTTLYTYGLGLISMADSVIVRSRTILQRGQVPDRLQLIHNPEQMRGLSCSLQPCHYQRYSSFHSRQYPGDIVSPDPSKIRLLMQVCIGWNSRGILHRCRH